MRKKKDLQPNRKVTLAISAPTSSDQIGDVFKVSSPSHPEISSKKMGCESDSNGVRMGCKSGAESSSNRVQMGCDVSPQNSKWGAEWGAKSNRMECESGANGVQNRRSEASLKSILTLRGEQRQIIDFFFQLCLNSGEKITPCISTSDLLKTLRINRNSARSAIKRLIIKGVILRADFQEGRAGWSKFELNQNVYRELLENSKKGANGVQMGCKSSSEWGAEWGANGPSSSSKILDLTNNNWETTDREKITDLSKDPAWARIDFDCLAQIGFNRSHVAQVASSKVLTPDSLQDSIYAFYFDLNVNQKGSKIGGPPLNFFMGILRRGPYSAPANYESPEDKQLREYLDAKENLLKKRRERLERLKALEFEEWVDSLPSLEVERLAPMVTTDVLKRSQLMNHFDSHLWAEKKRVILEGLKQKLVGERGTAFVESLENPLPDRGQLPPLNPP